MALPGAHYRYFLWHNLVSRLTHHRRPLLAGFKVTHRCNLRCRACPFWRRPADDIPFEKAVEVLDAFERAGVRLLIFEGGEPFLWRDGERRLEDLVQEARRRFFAVGITTNGTLPIETSADIVWVSIDGLRETHNANRGPIFDRVMETIRASAHPKILANVTINRLNVDEIPALVRFLAEEPNIRGITIQFFYPYAESEDLRISPAQRRQVLDQLLALKRQGYPILDSYSALEALKDNSWKCYDWLIADADPDGRIHLGCYLKDRGEIHCEQCGFAAHTELSLAFAGNIGAIHTGHKVFGFR